MKITALQFLIYALATFRLSLLISKEDGPAWIFAKLRKLPPPKSSAREGLSCIYCVSVYMATGIVALINYADHPLGDAFILMLALSAAAICINQQFTKG